MGKTTSENARDVARTSFPSLWRAKIRYGCQDETRLGLKTIGRRKITLFGVKPRGVYQNRFDDYCTYGLIKPISGESFFYDFSRVNEIFSSFP
jgi:hypothetical protein